VRRKIVTGLRDSLGKLVASELHAVAGIANEPDDDAIQFLYRSRSH
jgi:hypothetical protein